MPYRRHVSQSRYRWPPSPSVEDEVESLSREHTPVLPELVGGDVPMRGEVDQQPIILDAIPQELRSKSSSESLGPPTPTESVTHSDDRRFVWVPNQNATISPENSRESNGRGRGGASSKHTEHHSGRTKDKPPPLPPRQTDRDDGPESVPLRTNRERSPYVYSPSSAKTNHSSDYAMSPDTLSPNARVSTARGDGRDRPAASHKERIPFSERQRTMSSSSGFSDHHPAPMRHASGAAYPGEVQSPSFQRDPSKISRQTSNSSRRRVSPLPSPSFKQHDTRDTFESSDSDLSSDGESRRSDARRNRGHSSRPAREFVNRKPAGDRVDDRRHIPSSHHRNTTTSQGSYPHNTNSIPIPQGSKPAHEDATPVQRHRTYSSTSQRSKMTSRVSPGNSPYSTPPPSPGLPSQRDYPSPRPSSPRIKGNRDSLELPGYYHTGQSMSSSPSTLAPKQTDYLHDGRTDFRQEMRAPRSRHTSPLPTPSPEPTSGVQIGIQGPSPAQARTWPVPSKDSQGRPLPGELSAPFMQASGRPRSSGNNNVSPVQPHITPSLRRDDSNASRSQHDRSAPSSPVPPRSPTRTPIAKPRLPITLPACPRSNFSTGHDDWSSLASAPDFDICPSCRAALEDIGFKGKFYANSPSARTKCDLSVPWVRMAFLLILQNRAPHQDLINELMSVFAENEPCPGRKGGYRKWARLYNPESEKYVSNFDVCPHCVGAVETIFPNLRGAFQVVPSSSSDSVKRSCDLRVESLRFPRYIDLLEEISNQANERRHEPNMMRFVKLAKHMGSIRECRRDDQLLAQPWHFMPRLPTFTVCEECFIEVVEPAIDKGSDLANDFNHTLQMPPSLTVGYSCQLYSPRMREIFQTACRREDFHALAASATSRLLKERELQARLEQTKSIPDEWRAEELSRLVDEWKNWE